MDVILSTLTRDELKGILSEVLQEANNIEPNKVEDLELIDGAEVASIFKVSKGTVNNWRKKGLLESYTIGRRRRYKRSEVYAALEQFMSNRRKLK